MLPFVTSLWIAAALGQAPASGSALSQGASPEAAWLKAVPAEAEVVVRVRAPQAVRDDLVKMIQAMSPTLGQQAGPALDMGLGQLAQRYGKSAQTAPFLVVARLPQRDENGPPAYAVIAEAKDYAAMQKQLAGPGGDAAPKPDPSGVDVLKGADGQPIYSYKGPGFIAFGSSKGLVAAIARPRTTLDKALSPDLMKRLVGGDLGVYVNLAAVQARYGDQIAQARKGLTDQLDKAAAGGKPGGQNLEGAKQIYGRAFDALKNADMLALHFDFDPKGLTVAGLGAVKPGSDAVKALERARPGTGEAIANLPSDAALYTYASINPENMDRFQQLATSMAPGGGGKPSPEQEKALRLAREAGPKDVTGAVSFGKGGVRAISVISYDDPRKAAEAAAAGAEAMKANKSALPDIIKDIAVDRDAEKYKGFTFARTRITYDKEKIAQLGKNDAPNAPKANPSALLGDGVTSWSGTDGKTFLTVTAPDWSQAKSQIDAVLSGGQGGVGQAAAFQALRSALPSQVGSLFVANAQNLVRQGFAQVAAAAPDSPVAKADLDLPKTPAFLGGAVTPGAKGYQFQFLIPSDVGPVVEQAVLPLMQGNKAQQ